jgi:hypothetical protein
MTSLRRTFCANGRVDASKHFYIDPSEWNTNTIIPKIEAGAFLTVMAPSQTGKTTRMARLVEQLLNDGRYLPIFFQLDSNIGGGRLYQSFFRSIARNVFSLLNQDIKFEEPTFAQIFDKRNREKYFGGKNVVLIVDEIQRLSNADNDERQVFLDDWLNCKEQHEQFCLSASIILTNYVGNYIQTKYGTPINNSQRVQPPYFTRPEVKELFNQYDTEYEVKTDDKILNSIFEETTGAPGLTQIFGMLLSEMRSRSTKDITFTEWKTYLLSTTIVVNVKKFENYRAMSEMLATNMNLATTLARCYLLNTNPDKSQMWKSYCVLIS